MTLAVSMLPVIHAVLNILPLLTADEDVTWSTVHTLHGKSQSASIQIYHETRANSTK